MDIQGEKLRKIVDALKIKKVHTRHDGVDLEFDPPFGRISLTKAQLEERPEPKDGMYFVRFEDGYTSFAAADPFERAPSVKPLGLGVAVKLGTVVPRPVYHLAEVVLDGKHDRQPFLAHCSCGTEGRFSHQEAAYQWIDWHLQGQDEPPVSREPLLLEEAVLAEVAVAEAVAERATVAEVVPGRVVVHSESESRQEAEHRGQKHRHL